MKKRIITFFTTVLLIFTIVFNQKVYGATASTSISAGKTTLELGETTTINVSVSNTEVYNLKISSSGGILSGTTENADAFDNETSQTVMSATFKATTAGTYTITLSGQIASSEQVDNGAKGSASGSVTITVKEAPKQETNNSSTQSKPPINVPNTPKSVESTPVQADNKSRNNYLKSLSVSVGKLTPDFLPDTSEYEVVFDDGYNLRSLQSIEISAEAEDDKATVSGEGTRNLENGENYLEVVVKAENGNYRTYKIKIVKPDKIDTNELKLKSLRVYYKNSDGNKIPISYSKGFNADVKEYVMNLPVYAKSLIVEPEIENSEITVKIEGQDNLKIGENIITITLVSPDDENVKTEYKIYANVLENEVIENNLEKIDYNNPNKIVLITSTVVYNTLTLLLIGVLITMYVKQNNKDIQEILEGTDNNVDYTEVNSPKNDETKSDNIQKDSIFINENNDYEEDIKDKKYKGKRFE